MKKTRLFANEKELLFESDLLMKCDSSFIVRYSRVIHEENELWVVFLRKWVTEQIIMELCHCGSLAAYIRNGNRLTEDELREIASCCLLGLNYLHQHNIIHRVSDWDYG